MTRAAHGFFRITVLSTERATFLSLDEAKQIPNICGRVAADSRC